MGTVWRVRGRELPVDRPVVMGILNVTPDSFSDGGRHLAPETAVTHAKRMLDEGADIIDVGGESTRPQNAGAVSSDEELRRVIPVVERLASDRPQAVISIDTVKSTVAGAALDAGAHAVNDVSGLRLDPRMAGLCAERGAGLVLMHSRGDVATMATYVHARYADVVTDVLWELGQQVDQARAAGVADDAIVLDPGIGFSKQPAQSIAMLAAIPRLLEAGFPVLIGASRKRFIGAITEAPDPSTRLSGTLGANVAALALGARIFRVHDVAANRQALDVAWEILKGGGTG